MGKHCADFFLHLLLVLTGSILQVNASSAKCHRDEDEGGEGHCVGNAVERDVFFHVISLFEPRKRSRIFSYQSGH